MRCLLAFAYFMFFILSQRAFAASPNCIQRFVSGTLSAPQLRGSAVALLTVVAGEYSRDPNPASRILRQEVRARVRSIPSSLRKIGDMTQYIKKLRAELRDKNSLEMMPKMRTQSGSPKTSSKE